MQVAKIIVALIAAAGFSTAFAQNMAAPAVQPAANVMTSEPMAAKKTVASVSKKPAVKHGKRMKNNKKHVVKAKKRTPARTIG